MSDVFYLRDIDPPIQPSSLRDMVQYAGGCFRMHGVDWFQSFLAKSGNRMLCWYRARDAESARIALRQLGSDMNAVWAATVIGGEGKNAPTIGSANVLAEFQFQQPLENAEKLLSSAIPAGLSPRPDVCLVRGFIDNSRTRMVCVFAAKNAETVQSTLAAAGLSAAAVWPCTAVTPGLDPA